MYKAYSGDGGGMISFVGSRSSSAVGQYCSFAALAKSKCAWRALQLLLCGRLVLAFS